MTVRLSLKVWASLLLRHHGRNLIRAIISAFLLAGCGEQPPAEEKITPVSVISAQPGIESTGITLSGTVVPRVESQLAFQVAGRVVTRRVDMGALVKPGEVLAQLDETPFRLAREEAAADLARVSATLARTGRDVERNRRLAKTGAIAAADFDAIETLYTAARSQVRAAQSRLDSADNELGYVTLRAPAEGTIALIQAEVGQVVAAGTPVLRLARSIESEIQVDMPENRIGSVIVGQPGWQASALSPLVQRQNYLVCGSS